MRIIYYSAKPDSPAEGYWDQALLRDTFSNSLFTSIPDDDGAVVVLPGAYQGKYIKDINFFLSNFRWVILIISSDEESKFPVEKIEHPNIKIFVQYPKVGRHEKYEKWPLGYTSETRKNIVLKSKDLDIFYSGQKTHIRRELLSSKLDDMRDSGLKIKRFDTPGFTQGLDPLDYMYYMNAAKFAPAPSGAVSQDSFRLYEALEAGAIPIADDISPTGEKDFWSLLFGFVPFPVIKDYDSLPGYIKDLSENTTERANQIQAWWMRKKYDLTLRILTIYKELSGSDVTFPTSVVVPISYIKSHPNPKVLKETIETVRHWLPDSLIYLQFDGLRQEHITKWDDYQEFIRRTLFIANRDWGPVYPIIYPEHKHQIGMIRDVLPLILSDTLLYVEQDTPLVTDENIEWDFLREQIENGTSNMIRFHFEAGIPEAHKTLVIGEPENKLLKTFQWSQRPHLASVPFYKRIVEQYFSPDADCFLEDVLHGKLAQSYIEDGMLGWNQWRVHIYWPNDKNIKRSLHSDGRAGGAKYDDKQKF